MRDEFDAKTRKAIKARANGFCEKCGTRIGPGNPGEAHHKRACWKDGKGTLENGLWLGKKCCHAEITAEEATIRAKADRQRKSAWEGKKTKFRPLPGTKASGWKKTFDGKWVRR